VVVETDRMDVMARLQEGFARQYKRYAKMEEKDILTRPVKMQTCRELRGLP
jgi:hypothetical protein